MNAHAKINLSLDITGRRADGYHLIESLMQSLELSDSVTVERLEDPKEQGQIYLSVDDRRENPQDIVPADASNLMVRAAKLLLDRFDITDGIRLRLEKHIPMAAGLGGGSADAAAVLLAVNETFGLGLSLSKLQEIGLTLGADIPYCLAGGCALAGGIGEEITPVKSRLVRFVLLAKPVEGVSTGAVYKAYDSLKPDEPKHPDTAAVLRSVENGDAKGLIASMANVLETVTAAQLPVIPKIEDCMKRNGAEIAMMSGSGPTVFGLFDSEDAMHGAYKALSDEFKGRLSDLIETKFFIVS